MRKITLRKRLCALLVCVFAWVGANAEQFVEPNILELTPYDVNNKDFGNLTSDNQTLISNGTITTIKLVGNFSSGWSGYLLKKGASWGGSITTIDLSSADFSGITATLTKTTDTNGNTKITGATVSPGVRVWGFNGFSGLRTIIWPSADKISVIPADAFQYTGIQEVTIPGYIKYIGQHAFDEVDNAKSLKKVIFAEYPKSGQSQVEMYIETQAFNLTKGLMDVYVETLGTLSAGTNAFPHSQTYGHSDPNSPMATLHFPAEKSDDYVNKGHTLDEETANDDGLFQAWLATHYVEAGTAQNGFYEFVTNGPNPPKDGPNWGDVVLRTFSDAKLDYVVPNGVKAYIVNKVWKATGENYYRMLLQKVNVIPAGTGVILYGGTNATTSDGTKKYLSLMAVEYTGPVYGYNSNADANWRNLLVGTAKTDGAGTTVEPYEMEGNTVTWRNFFMGKYKNTRTGSKPENKSFNDFVGFFRALNTSPIASGKAYLHVPAAEYDFPSGGEIVVPEQGWDQYATEFKPGQATTKYTDAELIEKGWWHYGSANTPITWTVDWGVRNINATFAKFDGEPFIFDDEDGVATLIVPTSMVEVEDTGDYYTLQGVKVSNPSKGVYIKDGKKVVIK